MAAPLKKQEFEQHQEVTEQSKYHTFEFVNPDDVKFQELIFFIKISSFSIATVLSCFVLLANNWAPSLAFPIGILLGAGSTYTLAFLLDLLKR